MEMVMVPRSSPVDRFMTFLDWTDARTALEGSRETPQEGDAPREGPAELLQDLNEPQREAVRHGDGPHFILAGAG